MERPVLLFTHHEILIKPTVFVGPQGTAKNCNPSNNSLAVGPDHIVQIVNSRMAVYTKKGW